MNCECGCFLISNHYSLLSAAHIYTIMLFLLFHVMRELEQGGGFRSSVLLHIFSSCAHLPLIDDHIIWQEFWYLVANKSLPDLLLHKIFAKLVFKRKSAICLRFTKIFLLTPHATVHQNYCTPPRIWLLRGVWIQTPLYGGPPKILTCFCRAKEYEIWLRNTEPEI